MDTNLLLLPKTDARLGKQGRGLGAGQDHLLPIGTSHVHLDTDASNAVFGFVHIFVNFNSSNGLFHHEIMEDYLFCMDDTNTICEGQTYLIDSWENTCKV